MTYYLYPGARLYFTFTQTGVPRGTMTGWLYDDQRRLYLLTAMHNLCMNPPNGGTIKSIACASNNAMPITVIDNLNSANANKIVASPNYQVCDAAIVDVSHIKGQLEEANFAIGGDPANGFLDGMPAPAVNGAVKAWNVIPNPPGAMNGTITSLSPFLRVTLANGSTITSGNSGGCVYEGAVTPGTNNYGLLGLISFGDSANSPAFQSPTCAEMMQYLTGVSRATYAVANWANRANWA